MGYEMLELYEAKVSRTVLRGEERSNPLDLPDNCLNAALSIWGNPTSASIPFYIHK